MTARGRAGLRPLEAAFVQIRKLTGNTVSLTRSSSQDVAHYDAQPSTRAASSAPSPPSSGARRRPFGRMTRSVARSTYMLEFPHGIWAYRCWGGCGPGSLRCSPFGSRPGTMPGPSSRKTAKLRRLQRSRRSRSGRGSASTRRSCETGRAWRVRGRDGFAGGSALRPVRGGCGREAGERAGGKAAGADCVSRLAPWPCCVGGHVG